MHFYSPSDLEQLPQDLPYLTETIKWVENFLGKSHPDLGRPGLVCPFVPRALKLNTIRLAVVQAKNLQQAQIEAIVKQYRERFLELAPQQGERAFYKALMIVFPDVSPEEATMLVDGIQQKLKPFFVEEGLMLGEFHQLNESPGLHNPHFRPLRSPIPMLAIRYMTESDLPFLDRLTDEPQVRVRYLEAYLKRISADIKDAKKLNHAQTALALAQAQLEQGKLESSSQARRCPFAPLIEFFRAAKKALERISK
jgi:hypothetical protein